MKGSEMDIEEPRGDDSGKEVYFRIVDGENVPVHFSNFISASHDRAVFQILFGQFMQPIIASPADEQAILEKGFADVKPLVRFVFTPMMMQEMIDIFTSQLETYNQQRALEEAQGRKEVANQ